MMDKIMEIVSSKHFKILAVILCMILLISLVCCTGGGNEAEVETTPSDPTEIMTEPPTEEPTEAPTEPAPVVVVNMGTVTAGELNIRKGADSGYEKVGTYEKGDRIEILEKKTGEDGTVWGRTNLGWVGMGYVVMDGTAAAAGNQDGSASKIFSDGNYKVLGYGVVDLGELNVRLGPGTDYAKIGTVKLGNRYAYYQTKDNWARIEGGWVSTDYFYMEGTVADDSITGIVKEDDLNIRTGPNTSFRSVGTYKKDETVQILAQVDAWGYTAKGWIFLPYIEAVEPTYTTGTGIVTIGLNVRKEPNAESEIVGSYLAGETVTINEVNGSWGRTSAGWINLQYVSYG